MKIYLQKKGFTLIEAMVAISILSLAITGPMVIAQKGIASAIYSRDQITSFYLAQEAVEYVRNVRDTNRITGAFWLNGLSSCLQSVSLGQTCEIDARFSDWTLPGAIQSCPGGVCSVLSMDTSSGLYGYGTGSTWQKTPFTRTVSIDDRASSKEASISVTISWNTNLFLPVKTFNIKEYIFNF